MDEMKRKLRAHYGDNKRIVDDDYDKSLAVKCLNGTFVGKKTDNVIAYRGIPFVARQPVGDLRWKAPVEYVPDDGIYEAYYYAKSAYGKDEFEDGSHCYQSEECLYLNVWKTAESADEKKPVMIWVHGGAFEMGTTLDPMFDFVNFLNENPDVIVVSIAYRLGVFGFFHLSHLPDGKDYQDSHNLGLMDQMMALKWVHENIAAFGGDPDNITLWGESAGAACVTLLPLIEGSQKYFKRVIAQSGTPSLTRNPEDAIECTNEMLEILGCKSVEDLKKIDAKMFVEASSAITLKVAPERDGKYLPLNPYDEYAKGAAKDIIFLQGCNKDEMNTFMLDHGEEAFSMWAADRKQKRLAKLPDEDKKLVESFCNDMNKKGLDGDIRLLEQAWFNGALIRISESQTMAGGKSYTYFFTVESSVPGLKSGHAIELPAVCGNPEMAVGGGRAFDETFSKTMRKMWVQFAKTGNPSLTADISPDGRPKEWPLYEIENRKVMVLDESDIHPEKESEINIVDWKRIYPLTEHYWL